MGQKVPEAGPPLHEPLQFPGGNVHGRASSCGKASWWSAAVPERGPVRLRANVVLWQLWGYAGVLIAAEHHIAGVGDADVDLY